MFHRSLISLSHIAFFWALCADFISFYLPQLLSCTWLQKSILVFSSVTFLIWHAAKSVYFMKFCIDSLPTSCCDYLWRSFVFFFVRDCTIYKPCSVKLSSFPMKEKKLCKLGMAVASFQTIDVGHRNHGLWEEGLQKLSYKTTSDCDWY